MNELKNFDESVISLLKLSFEIHDKTYGSVGDQKLWIIWTNKFTNLYNKAKNPEHFIEVFNKFFYENDETIGNKIFEENEDGEIKVNDEWLKINGTIQKKTKEWTPSNSKCKGKIIYFKKEDEKFNAICIPVSEIYNCAIKLYKEKGDKDSYCKTYPAKFLYIFYSIYLFSLPKANKYYKIIENNAKEIFEHLEIITPVKNNDNMSSNVGGGVSKIIQGVLSAAGINNNFNSKTIDSLLSKAGDEQNINKIGSVLKEVVTVFNSSSTTTPDGIIDGIGKVIKSDIVKESIADITNFAKTEMGSTETSTGTSTETSTEICNDDPDEQE